ncbi:MAG: hypothetical protein H8E66_25630 [Planctomycetes bacterium]|nr:hypothetical protein [Planctomycetota bacterium]
MFFVLGLTLLAALWELTEPDPEGSPNLKVFPSMWAELYPESAATYYVLARAAAEQGDLEEARLHFERALAKEDKTNEDLYYDYAVLLVRMRADRKALHQAVSDWKRYFPMSARRDPSKVEESPR